MAVLCLDVADAASSSARVTARGQSDHTASVLLAIHLSQLTPMPAAGPRDHDGGAEVHLRQLQRNEQGNVLLEGRL